MKNKNITLIIGIALPILFITIISIVIFTPNLFIKPQYNFLYSIEDSYYSYNQQYLNSYSIQNGHLVSTALPVYSNTKIVYKGDNPPLFLYDVKNNSTHQINFVDTKNLSIEAGPSSPDGYIVKYQYSNDGIFGLLGSNNNQNGHVIAKGNGSKKLDGLDSGNYGYSYNENFKFIGWIK